MVVYKSSLEEAPFLPALSHLFQIQTPNYRETTRTRLLHLSKTVFQFMMWNFKKCVERKSLGAKSPRSCACTACMFAPPLVDHVGRLYCYLSSTVFKLAGFVLVYRRAASAWPKPRIRRAPCALSRGPYGNFDFLFHFSPGKNRPANEPGRPTL